MGKGRIVILGNSAHPLRHTGQDENLALEDAAELGAAVQQFGLSKEALRRFEQRRRPRWKHVMQVGRLQPAANSVRACAPARLGSRAGCAGVQLLGVDLLFIPAEHQRPHLLNQCGSLQQALDAG